MAPSSMRREAIGRSEATLFLDAAPSSVFALEEFVDGLDFLARRERERLKLAGDEILDNLIRHSAPLQRDRIALRAARRGGRIFLIFFFRSPSFAAFAESCSDPLPLYDPGHRRWRGIGMVMCRNLANSIRLRPGSHTDRIFMTFLPEPDESQMSPWRQPGQSRHESFEGEGLARAGLSGK